MTFCELHTVLDVAFRTAETLDQLRYIAFVADCLDHHETLLRHDP